MTIVAPSPITGREAVSAPDDPLGALREFYRAFNTRDLALMGQNWLRSGEASMANPLGGLRRGWAEIRPVYERIFGGAAEVEVEFFDYAIDRSVDAFLAVGRERGVLRAGQERLELRIRTSRWFRLEGGRFRQLHHHGSIEEPDLLARYREAVR